jgi:hypothetical protein
MHALNLVLNFQSVIFKEINTRNQGVRRDRVEKLLKLQILPRSYIIVQHKGSKLRFHVLYKVTGGSFPVLER